MLRKVVSEAPAGFVLGVFGPSGSGKSSVALIASSDVSDARVWLDASRYESEAFRRELLLETGEQLRTSGVLPRSGTGRDLDDLRVEPIPTERIRLSWRQLIRNLFGVALLATAWLVVGGVIVDTEKAGLSLIAVLPLLTYLATRAEQVVQVQAVTVAPARLQDPSLFARRLRELLGTASAERVVIIVDGLADCAPDQSVAVLSAIRAAAQYAHVKLPPTGKPRRARAPRTEPDVVFIVIADRELLRRRLASTAPRIPGEGDSETLSAGTPMPMN